MFDDVNDELQKELETEHDVDLEAKQQQQQASDEGVKDEPQGEGPSVPEKFANKSKEEIAQSYTELEKTLGKQAQEIGELRKFTDQYLMQEFEKTSKKEEPKEQDLSFDDLVENPKEAIGRAVDSKVSELDSKIEELNRANSLKQFEDKHPDYQDVVKNSEFMEWVKSSPYRTRQFQAADQFDFEAADDLISTFKERKEILQKQVKSQAQEKTQEELKSVQGETGSSGEKSKKVYRRADLIRLRMHDPERFEAMSDEIHRAYAEGRVK